MAKKRKKHRHPKAPPVHSAPEAAPQPTATPAQQTPAGHPEGAPPPAAPAPRRAPRGATRRSRKGDRTRTRLIAAGVALVLLIVGAFVYQQVQSRRAAGAHAELAASAGCDDVTDVGGLDRDHVTTAVEYESSPPAGGPHAGNALPASVYNEPFSTTPGQSPSIYSAVHSLEHGYIIAWHDGLDDDERADLERELRAERKVIVVPYPELEEGRKMALTAWGKLQVCDEADPEVALSFVELFREQTAPEAEVP